MIEYTLIRSKRKTIALTVTRELTVIVRAPLRMPAKDIETFVVKYNGWIQKHTKRIKEQKERFKSNPLTNDEIVRLKQKAAAYLPQRTAYFSSLMGVSPAGIKITSAKSRWGSVSGKNSICYSYRVMQLPEDLIDYVIVHELSHIRVKNHSPRFYHEVAKYMPDHQERRNRLKEIYV